MSPDLVADIEVTRAQNRNYALADGFPLFLRYKAQAERLYRCAVEEFDRVKALRDEFPKEAISDPQPEETEPPSTPAEEPSGTCFSLFVPGAERPNDASSNPEPDVEPDVPEAPSVSEGAPSPADVPEAASAAPPTPPVPNRSSQPNSVFQYYQSACATHSPRYNTRSESARLCFLKTNSPRSARADCPLRVDGARIPECLRSAAGQVLRYRTLARHHARAGSPGNRHAGPRRPHESGYRRISS